MKEVRASNLLRDMRCLTLEIRPEERPRGRVRRKRPFHRQLNRVTAKERSSGLHHIRPRSRHPSPGLCGGCGETALGVSIADAD